MSEPFTDLPVFLPFDWGTSQDEIVTELIQLWPTDDQSLARCAHELATHQERLYVKSLLNDMLPLMIASCGEKGIDALVALLYEPALRMTKRVHIVQALWALVCGSLRPIWPTSPEIDSKLTNVVVTDDVRKTARNAFFDFVASAVTNPLMDGILGSLLTQDSLTGKAMGRPSMLEGIVEALQALSLKLSPAVMQAFEGLLKSEEREEEYQRFFEVHPVLLDPLASHLIDKHKLGNDLITDFVAVRLTNDYLVVEIEKPSTPIFYSNGDFHRDFMHGFRQVIDFQEWLAQHIAYAQSKLPGIKQPHGLLVVGMIGSLSSDELARFNRFRSEHHFIEIVGYDELLERARTLYKNLRSS